MINELQIAAFNAAYAKTIDSDAMEQWPDFFTRDCHYRVTNVDNHAEGLAAGIVWADSRDMLADRISALREANIYERHRYRHILGLPLIQAADAAQARASTPFMVLRIMHTGETEVFASGEYLDWFAMVDGRLRLQERVAVCDSTVTDTLMALPL
jgi:anthranilate 1,2-dioxygenase small subunit/terephthalate 1,2-dioxygenase oxygenase component beta subunit